MKKILTFLFLSFQILEIYSQPIVFFNFLSHNEETNQWNGANYYNLNRTKIIALSNYFQLKGITWNHSRGITPLLAASQRYTELHPQIEITWTKRTLQEFADFPIEKLTEQYDLLIIDHPWVGCAAATNCVLPLNEYLSNEYLQNQAENSVGFSHNSYNYKDKQ